MKDAEGWEIVEDDEFFWVYNDKGKLVVKTKREWFPIPLKDALKLFKDASKPQYYNYTSEKGEE